MKRTKFILIFLLIFCTNLTGCSDKRELDDQVYALAIGVDKGVDNKARITFQYPSYRSGKGQQSDGGSNPNTGNTIINTVEAPSVLEGLNVLGTSTTRRISLVHVKAIFLSEDLAREGIGDLLQAISRYRETRRIIQIIVCKGSAQEFIEENKTLIGQSLSKAMELKELQSEDNGFFPRVTFDSFYRSAISPYSQPFATYAGLNPLTNLNTPAGQGKKDRLRPGLGMLPGTVPRSGNIRSEYVGTAVFNGDTMIGSLDSYETRYFLMITGKFKRGTISLEDKNDPDKALVLDIRPGRRPKVNSQLKDGKITINVKLNVEADIVSIQSKLPYDQLSNIDDLNTQLNQTVKKGVIKVIEKCQKELESDIFMFGYKVAHNFPTIEAFENYDWKSNFSKASVQVEVVTNIRRTGLMIESSPIKYNKSKFYPKEEK